MSKNEPVDARIRLAIAQWPDDAPRGSVTTFCAEHQISRKTFYAILARARDEGQAAALEPRSRRPKTSPGRISSEVKEQALGVRAALESSGLDYGPISVHDKMRALGMDAPSVASLARIFRQTGVARAEPKKKPRSAWRRFVYPAPNACWQLDATEYVLTGGRTCVIFQLIDDHSRYALASLVAPGETVDAAITVVKKGIRTHGVPQRLLTDNGLALNPSRRGVVGQLVTYVTGLGVEAITGKPYKPTTQGKNERIHQTLFRFLDKQPWPATWPSSRHRSTPSTSSTTPNGPTRACPDASPRCRPGPPQPRPSHPAPRRELHHQDTPSTPSTASAPPPSAPTARSEPAESNSRSAAATPANSPTSSTEPQRSSSSTTKAPSSPRPTGPNPASPTSAPTLSAGTELTPMS